MTELFASFPSVDFRPHPLLRSGHAQTVMAGCWAGQRTKYRANQIVIPTTNDDRLVLHDDQPQQWADGSPVALLIHGLGGCHLSSYMVRIATKLNAVGVRTFRMDMRGCGSGDRLARHPGHAGRSEDVAAAVDHLITLCPSSSRAAVGFSLGGNLLLKWLGEAGASASQLIHRALAVSTPIDLSMCARNMARRERRIYDRWFVTLLNKQVNSRRDHINGLANLDLSLPPRTLYEFDDRITAPLSGFLNAEEYYAQCSSAPLLAAIQTPTVLLSAADDPLIPSSIYSSVSKSPKVAVRLVPNGGHVGFFGRSGRDPDWHWLDWRVVEFVQAEMTE